MKIEWLIADKLAVGSLVGAERAVFWVMLIFFSKFVPLLCPGEPIYCLVIPSSVLNSHCANWSVGFLPKKRPILTSKYAFPSRPCPLIVFSQILATNIKIFKLYIFALKFYIGTGTYVDST